MRRLLILLTAVALLVAGCGGGGSSSGETTVAAPPPPLTRAQYQQRLQSLIAGISKRLGRSTTAGNLTNADIDGLADAFRSFAERLRNLRPPPAVKALHARLVKAMTDFGNEFPQIAKRLKAAKDPSTAISALLGSRSVQELYKVVNELKAKGYELDLNG